MKPYRFHAMFKRVRNAEGRMQYRCIEVWEGRDDFEYFPATEHSPAEVFVNLDRKPPVGKFCRRPHFYMDSRAAA